MAEESLFDEWAEGVKLAGSPNAYFQEIETELDKPANFSLPDPKPETPDPPVAPIVEAQAPVQDEGPEVIELEGGGTVTVEKTSKGWKGVLDSQESGVPLENFYGATWRQLLANVCKGKLQASKAIRRLKKEKLLEVQETRTPEVPSAPKRTPKVTPLTADDMAEVQNLMGDNAVSGLDTYFQKRFGMSLEEVAESLKSAGDAKTIVEMQNVQRDVGEVNQDFIRENPDYAENYLSDENARLLIQRLAKVYLHKSVSKDLKHSVDNVIFELYEKGFWTAENLETAKDELIESGLLELTVTPRPTPKPKREPVAVIDSPSESPAPRIAASPGQTVGLGLPARNSTPTVVPDEKPLTDVDLQSLPLEDLRKIAQAQLQAMQRRG